MTLSFRRSLVLIAALTVLEVVWTALPGGPRLDAWAPTMLALRAALLFGVWVRARVPYWLYVAIEGFNVLSDVVFVAFLGQSVAIAGALVFSGARLALLLSPPVRTAIGRRRAVAQVA